MAKKHNDGYLSAKESRRISKGNRKITNALEKKRKRKNVPRSEERRVGKECRSRWSTYH